MKNKVFLIKLTPKQVLESRYSDFGYNHALLESLHSRIQCPNPECNALVFSYDPDDENYLKCHKCGTRKRTPGSFPEYTPSDCIELMRVRDGFGFLFSQGLAKKEDKQ